ncbi:hypothetical protein ACFJIV_04340 [Mucilaginibacter sp. UC70_90]
MNFRPNKMASLLASRKILNFAILIPAVSDETDYWSYPLNGIKQAADEIRQFGVTVQYYFYDLNSKSSFHKAADELLKTTLTRYSWLHHLWKTQWRLSKGSWSLNCRWYL